MSEKEWLRSTPRKISALYKIHRKVHGLDDGDKTIEQKEKRLYIDQVPFL